MSEPNTTLELIKLEIRQSSPIRVVALDACEHRLHLNENPFDLPEALKAAILQELAGRPWSHHTGFRPYRLIERLAELHGVDAAQVVVTSGSTELIRATLNAILSPGDGIVLPTPTFPAYQTHSQLLGAAIHVVPLSPATNFALPVDELIECARTQRAKLIVICAPNNPTGTFYAADELRRVAERCGCLLLIDEAYAFFSGQDLTALVTEFDNVILSRTFSKAFSMAAVRVGYGLAAAPLAAELQKLVSPFPLSLFAEVATRVALDHLAYFAELAKALVHERECLAEQLDELPSVLQIYPSVTNFLLIKLDQPSQPLIEHLRNEHRILITDMSRFPTLPNHIRISVGTPAQNELVVKALRAFL